MTDERPTAEAAGIPPRTASAGEVGAAIGRYVRLPKVFESYTQLGQDVLDTLASWGVALYEPITGDMLRAAIAAATPLTNPRLSEVDWDAVAEKLEVHRDRP